METIVLISDLDKQSPADETVEFSLDGQTWEIDLTEDQAADLRDRLAPFVAKAPRSRGKRGRPRLVAQQAKTFRQGVQRERVAPHTPMFSSAEKPAKVIAKPAPTKGKGKAPAKPAKAAGGRKGYTYPAPVAAIREWAGRNGYEVSAQGRIAAAVLEAYAAAH